MQKAFELRDLLSKHIWGVKNPPDDAKATGIGNSGSKLRSSSHIHTCKHDRMINLKEVGDGGAKLFLKIVSSASTDWDRNTYEEKPWWMKQE